MGTANTRGAPEGNRNNTKNKPWAEAVRRALMQADGKRLRKIAEALITKAESGDVAALKEIGDRMDGKAHQSIDATVDASVVVNIKRFGD